MKTQIALLALALVSSMASADMKLKCSYATDAKNTMEFDVSAESTAHTVNLETAGGTYSFSGAGVLSKSFGELRDAAASFGISGRGIAYAVSRSDKSGNVIVKVIVASVVQGTLANEQTAEWNFGLSDGSLAITTPQTLGNLTCQIQK